MRFPQFRTVLISYLFFCYLWQMGYAGTIKKGFSLRETLLLKVYVIKKLF